MKSLEILSVVYNSQSRSIEVIKRITNDDNTVDLAGHTFPVEAMEWWAADMETDDLATLFDLMMHEPYVDGVTDKQDLISKVNGLKSGFSKTPKSNGKDDAKEFLRSRGVSDAYIWGVDNDPLDILIGRCPMNAEAIELKRIHIQERKSAPTPRARSEDERLESIRKQLGVVKAKSPGKIAPIRRVKVLDPIVLNSKIKTRHPKEEK